MTKNVYYFWHEQAAALEQNSCYTRRPLAHRPVLCNGLVVRGTLLRDRFAPLMWRHA